VVLVEDSSPTFMDDYFTLCATPSFREAYIFAKRFGFGDHAQSQT